MYAYSFLQLYGIKEIQNFITKQTFPVVNTESFYNGEKEFYIVITTIFMKFVPDCFIQ